MSVLPGADAARKAGTLLLIVLAAAAVFVGGGLLLSRILPKNDPAPIVAARADEDASRAASANVGAGTAAANRDASVQVEITTKEIRDAFEAPVPPASAAAAGGPVLPAAPVDRLRDRLNESIARANRAADASGAPD